MIQQTVMFYHWECKTKNIHVYLALQGTCMLQFNLKDLIQARKALSFDDVAKVNSN